MAEITAQDLYEQLSPLEKQQYDGVIGMGGFKERYEKNPNSPRVTGDINYEKFKAIADAEAAVPEKGFFKSLISSASAAEPNKTSSVSGTPGFEIVAKPDGTIEVVPVGTSNDLPFKSMAELAAENANLNLFPAPLNVSNFPANTFDDQVNFAPKQKPTPLMNLGFDTSFGVANEPDVKQVDYLGNEPVGSKLKRGLASLTSFLPFGENSVLGRLKSLLDFSDSPNYIPAPMGVYGYTPDQLNKMNALGGYYSDPMRAYRRNTNRISNMLQRAAADKSYSQKNLDTLMNQVGLGDVDTGGMIDSIKANAGYEGGFDRSTGNYEDPYSDDTE